MERSPLRLDWSSQYATGLNVFDGEHQVMFMLFNDFSRAMETRVSPTYASNAFDTLASHIRSHFAREERLLVHRGIALPPQRMVARREFRLIADTVYTGLCANSGRAAAATFLRDWICEHVAADRALIAPGQAAPAALCDAVPLLATG